MALPSLIKIDFPLKKCFFSCDFASLFFKQLEPDPVQVSIESDSV